MFIATNAYAKSFAPLGAKPSCAANAEARTVALLRSSGTEKGAPAINISPKMGRSDKFSVALPG